MIEINIRKHIQSYSGKTDLEIDLEIERGKFISLFGKSGAGKTTLLRILAGLVIPDNGYIKVDGKFWFDQKSGTNLIPQKRNIGFVFQDHSLFPNMTVKESLEFVSPDKKDKDWLAYLLEVMEMEKFASRKPDSLSGGQRQRAALARAIARRPSILLLDEPFSSLDPETRELLQNSLKKIHSELNLTTIMVSHDREEVFSLSDCVYELKSGMLSIQTKNELDKYHFGRLLKRDEGSKTCLVELENRKGKIIIEVDIDSFLEIINVDKTLII